MDPRSGQLYDSVEEAAKAGVKNPIELIGAREDVERVSSAVHRLSIEEKKQRRKRNKTARASRKRNR